MSEKPLDVCESVSVPVLKIRVQTWLSSTAPISAQFWTVYNFLLLIPSLMANYVVVTNLHWAWFTFYKWFLKAKCVKFDWNEHGHPWIAYFTFHLTHWGWDKTVAIWTWQKTFKIHVLVWKLLEVDSNFTEICFQWSSQLQTSICSFPADIWRNNNVIITSKRRCDVIMSLSLRYVSVGLGSNW